MANMQSIPDIVFDTTALEHWGDKWKSTIGSQKKDGTETEKRTCFFDKKQGMDFTKEVIDPTVASALAIMLGNIPVVSPQSSTTLLPPPRYPDCVEVGDTKVVGGVRPQNFDIAYRPDGIRIAYDSKTLNDEASVKKNWNNMINDLAAEASTVHIRFPFALAVFLLSFLSLHYMQIKLQTLSELSNA